MSADSDSRSTSSTAGSDGIPTVNTPGSSPVVRGGYSLEEWAHKIDALIQEAEDDGYVVFLLDDSGRSNLMIGPDNWDYENPQTDVFIRDISL